MSLPAENNIKNPTMPTGPIQAAVEPFTQTETWYGVFVALAMTKGIKRIANEVVYKIADTIDGDSGEDKQK